jgi:hypothetical protein
MAENRGARSRLYRQLDRSISETIVVTIIFSEFPACNGGLVAFPKPPFSLVSSHSKCHLDTKLPGFQVMVPHSSNYLSVSPEPGFH